MPIKAKNLLSVVLAQLGLIKRDSQRLSAIPLTERLKVALAAFGTGNCLNRDGARL